MTKVSLPQLPLSDLSTGIDNRVNYVYSLVLHSKSDKEIGANGKLFASGAKFGLC